MSPFSRVIMVIAVLVAAALVLTAPRADDWRDTPEGVALEFIDALDHLDLDRIMATQDRDATMFFPQANATFRLENKDEIRGRMSEAFAAGRARAEAAGVTDPPYLQLPRPVGMKVQMINDEAAVVSWMFDRPGNFGRRSAAMRRNAGGWKMVNFHSSNLLFDIHADAGTAVSGNALTREEIERILEAPDRPLEDRSRDSSRRPADILALSGVRRGDRVIELYPGIGAYYSRILAAAVGDKGMVYGITPPYVAKAAPQALEVASELDERRSNYESMTVDFHALELADPVDAIWMVNIYHDAPRLEYDRDAMNRHLHSLLKPGGRLLVIDHHAEPGSGEHAGFELHRGDAEMTRRELEAAGFELEASSEVLANPADDRSKSVFDPSIRGQTDRFVYLFRK